MPLPTTINDLSKTAGSNFPQGTDSPSGLDDTQRAHASFIAQVRDGDHVAAATAKTTLVDADFFPMNDSAASNILKKITWANIKAALAGLYQPVGSYAASGTNNDITSLTALTAGGLPDNSVITADIADLAVTTAKLADSSVTPAKTTGFVVTQANQTPLPAANSALSFTHGLGAVPASVNLELVCLTAEYGYAAGDIVYPYCAPNNVTYGALTPAMNASTVFCRTGNSTAFLINNNTNGVQATPTAANWAWRFRVRAA